MGASHFIFIDDADGSVLQIKNFGTGAHIGLRYERDNWAVETRLQNNMYEAAYNGNSPLVNLGAFIYF